MDIADPFCFFPGDFTLFYAATLEMMTRKLLCDHGFDQKQFTAGFTAILEQNGTGYYVWENMWRALDFVRKAVGFLGFRVIYRRKTEEDSFTAFAVKVPEIKKLVDADLELIKHRLTNGYFYSGYEVEIKNGTIFLRIYEDVAWDWRCLVNFVAGMVQLKEELKSDGGHGSSEDGGVSLRAVS